MPFGTARSELLEGSYDVFRYGIIPERRNMKKSILKALTVLLLAGVLTACGSGEEGTGTEGGTPGAVSENETEEEKMENVTATEEASETENAAETASTGESTEVKGLKDVYADDFLIGTVYTTDVIAGEDKEIVLANFNVLTPENIMKPENVQRVEGTFTYTDCDRMVVWMEKNSLTLHGHCLAWHQQSPDWMAADGDREKAISQLKEHITNVASHFDGDVYSWDVLNEAIKDGAVLPADGDWTECLRDTMWLRAIGPEYVELAFEFAREAAPDAVLYYNDYNLNDSNKAAVCAAMVSDLRSKGVPIDGIGMQGHYTTATSISSVAESLELFSGIDGIRISVSELDVGVAGVTSGKLTAAQETEQAVFYANLFLVYKEYADIIERVTFWGYKDSTSWRSETAPLLFNSDLTPKAAYYAVLNPEEYASLDVSGLGKTETKQAEAAYGTPVIDGTQDECWENAASYEIANCLYAWQGADGTVKVLWDEENIYALISVNDSVLNTSNANKYEQDSVEFFLDPNNCKNGSYDSLCGQYRVSCRGLLSFGTVPSKEGVESAVSETESGYLVELKIPVSGLKEGMELGFDAQINDANASGTRVSIRKFNATSDDAYNNPSMWGTLTLVK